MSKTLVAMLDTLKIIFVLVRKLMLLQTPNSTPLSNLSRAHSSMVKPLGPIAEAVTVGRGHAVSQEQVTQSRKVLTLNNRKAWDLTQLLMNT